MSWWDDAQKGTTEYWGIISGDYAHDRKNLKKKSDEYEKLRDEYEKKGNDLQGRLDKLSAYHDEVLQLKGQRETRELKSEYQPELKAIAGEYKELLDRFNKDYKMTNAALSSKYGKYFLWVPLVIGGLVSDIGDAVLHGDIGALKRIGSVVLKVLELATLIYLTVQSLGLGIGFTGLLLAAAIGSLVDTLITVDSLYGQGILMQGVFSTLDFLLNDVLKMDKWASNLDTYKLSDSQYYAELTGYIDTIAVLTKTVGELIAFHNAPEGWVSSQLGLDGLISGSSTLTYATEITSSLPFQTLYTIYQGSLVINNIEKQDKAYEALKEKLNQSAEKLERRTVQMRNSKMMKAFRETEDMLNYTSNIVSEYVMSGFSDPTSSFDPEMTIAANFGYRYSGSNVMDFVQDFTTDYDSLAGGESYTNKILYKI